MRAKLIVFLWAGLAAVAAAQTRSPDLSANMQAIAQALGVGCDFCHAAERGSGKPEPKKDIARAMIAMTRDINAKIQAVGVEQGLVTEVQCVTCHRGVPVPRQLSEILSQTLKTQGA